MDEERKNGESSGAQPEVDVSAAAAALGRKGMAIRWLGHDKGTLEERIRAKNHQARQAKVLKPLREAIEECEQILEDAGIVPFRRLKGIKDPEAYIDLKWARKVPRMWEALLQATMVGGNYSLAMDVLTRMTAMTRLNPEKLKKAIEDGTGLPSDVDLGSLDASMLERITGRKLLEHSETSTVKEGEALETGRVRRRRGRKPEPEPVVETEASE